MRSVEAGEIETIRGQIIFCYHTQRERGVRVNMPSIIRQTLREHGLSDDQDLYHQLCAAMGKLSHLKTGSGKTKKIPNGTRSIVSISSRGIVITPHPVTPSTKDDFLFPEMGRPQTGHR